MGYYDAEYIVARFFGMSEKRFLKSGISYIQRLCNRHYDETENERILRWNMMQGQPPALREAPATEIQPVSEDAIREAGEIVGNFESLMSDDRLKKIRSV